LQDELVECRLVLLLCRSVFSQCIQHMGQLHIM
jgi:hypothetical protein